MPTRLKEHLIKLDAVHEGGINEFKPQEAGFYNSA